jgi:hypothetical protein
VKDYVKGGILRTLKATGVTYRIWELSWADECPCHILGYELHQRRWQVGRDLGTHRIAEGEALPGDNTFGRWSWAHPTYDRAFKAAMMIRPHKSMAGHL